MNKLLLKCAILIEMDKSDYAGVPVSTNTVGYLNPVFDKRPPKFPRDRARKKGKEKYLKAEISVALYSTQWKNTTL
jgi:hypothetical protein